jgi:hypothetical protein
MEDVLEVYRRPYNPQRPQVCMDEAAKQLAARHPRVPAGGTGEPRLRGL